MPLPRSAVGAWRQPESLQRQGPNLARGVVVCQPLSGASVWKLRTEGCSLLRWCGILEYSLPLRSMCDTFHLSDSHTNRQSVAVTSDYLSPPAAPSPFTFYLISLVQWASHGSWEVLRFITDSLSALLLKSGKRGVRKVSTQGRGVSLLVIHIAFYTDGKDGFWMSSAKAVRLFKSHLLDRRTFSLQTERESI